MPRLILQPPGDEAQWSGPHSIDIYLGEGRSFRFAPGATCRQVADRTGIATVQLADKDVNAVDFRTIAKGIGMVVYSGFGGVLIRPETLRSGPRFLHAHGGIAPHYRGSTAFYYSLLREGSMGATVLWLEPGIDTGPILARKTFSVPAGLDIDRVVDPVFRAEVLVEVLDQRRRLGAFPAGERLEEGATTYYVIHPVLKNLALRRVAKRGGNLPGPPERLVSFVPSQAGSL